MERNERQDIIVDKSENNNFNGIVECYTGFGKTITSLKIRDRIKSKIKESYLINVIVPTTDLKTQWEEKTKNDGYSYNIVVINGAVQSGKRLNGILTIYDEVHMYINGNQFKTIFELTDTIYKIGLTATLSNSDKEEIKGTLPIIDTVTLEEGRRNKWVAEFVEYNLLIDFDSQEKRDDYTKIHQMHDECFAYFGLNFETARKCMNRWGAEKFVMENKFFPKKEDGSIMTINEATKFISDKANVWHHAMVERAEIINKDSNKIKTVVELLKIFNLKFITFGVSTETCDILTELIPNSKSYHTNIESEEIDRGLLLKYELIKPTKAEEKLLALYPEEVYKSKIKVKCGKDRLNKLYIKLLEFNDIKGINTAKKANLGLDIPGIDGILNYARNSINKTQIQRNGRGIRKEGDKFSLLINIAIKNTKDISWLKSAQWGTRGQVEVYSIEELVKHFNSIMK